MAYSHYWVELKLQIGEYEKYGYALVLAENAKDAAKFALALECHGNAHFEGDDTVYDMGGEMAYSVRSVIELSEVHASVMKEYFSVFTYDEALFESIK